MGAQNFFVDPWFIIKSFRKPKRNDLDQVLVTLIVFRKQHQMPLVFIFIRVFIFHTSGGRIDFTSDNRLDPVCQTFFIKVNDPEHYAVVGNGNGFHAQFFCSCHQIFYSGSAV